MTQRIILGPQYFPDPGVGRPIANGTLYIGEVDTDPTIPGNQIQVSAIQESGISIEIDQPISLSAGGVPLYEGSPVTLTVEEEVYAITLLDDLDQQIYYVPNSVDIIFPTTFSDEDFVIYDNNDNTKKLKFEVENLDNDITRSILMPNRDVDLSNKTDTFFIRDNIDETKKLGFNLSEITAVTTRYLKMIDDNVDLGNRTDDFRIRDSTDNTKQIKFDTTAITTETTRTITMPDNDIFLGNPFDALKFHIQDQKPSGTQGGAYLYNTWQDRDLNTVLTNEITGSSLNVSTGVFTLPPGRYVFQGTVPCYDTYGHTARVYNNTLLEEVDGSPSPYIDSSYLNMLVSIIYSYTTIVEICEFSVQGFAERALSNGMGRATNMLNYEIYTNIIIFKTA